MNYFERLVRRAKLRASSEPGMPLADPFENEDGWPLDPALTAAMAQRALGANVQTMVAARESVGWTTAASIENAMQAASSAVTPPATLAPVSDSSDAVVEAKNAPTAAPTVANSVAPVSAPTAAPVAPLEIADRFLRELGVRVAEETSAAPPSVVAPIAPAEVAAMSEIERATPVAQVVAPSAPIVEVRDGRESERPDAPATAASAPVPSGKHTARSPAAVTETRRVIVVERSASRGGDATSGGGAPRFGLGQL